MQSAVEKCVKSVKWLGETNPTSKKTYTDSEKYVISSWAYQRGRLSTHGEILGMKDALKQYQKNPRWFYSESQKLRKRSMNIGDILFNQGVRDRRKAVVAAAKSPTKGRIRTQPGIPVRGKK